MNDDYDAKTIGFFDGVEVSGDLISRYMRMLIFKLERGESENENDDAKKLKDENA